MIVVDDGYEETLQLARDYLKSGLYHQALPLYKALFDHEYCNTTLIVELSNAYHLTGESFNALKYLNMIMPADDEYIKATLLKGVICLPSDPERALYFFQVVEGIQPEDVETQLLIAQGYQALGELEKARAVFQGVVGVKEFSFLTNYYLAKLFLEMELIDSSLTSLFLSLRMNSKFQSSRNLLVNTLISKKGIRLNRFSEEEISILVYCFESETQGQQELSVALYPLLKYYLENSCKPGCYQNDLLFKLLNLVLRNTVVYDLGLENILKLHRKYFLFKYANSDMGLSRMDSLLESSLAIHALNNEYLWSIDDDEQKYLGHLRAKIDRYGQEESVQDGQLEGSFLLLVMYQRPSNESVALFSKDKTSSLKDLLKKFETVGCSSVDIPVLTKIPTELSKKVKNQYEVYPYPRWKNLPIIPQTSMSVWLTKRFRDHALDFPKDNNVLVAGCGTGQHALSVATRCYDSNVLAIDLSLKSLMYAKKQAEKFQIKNLCFAQADITELDDHEECFSIIESVGTLHHMEDVELGLRTLIKRLKPGGLIKLGLYSQSAREPVERLKALVEVESITPELETIRGAREFLINSPVVNAEDLSYVMSFSEFYNASGFVDLFFHVSEKAFTIPDLDSLLINTGLEFLYFELTGRQIDTLDGEPSPNSLSHWAEFEKIEPFFFRNMYQFWCRLPS